MRPSRRLLAAWAIALAGCSGSPSPFTRPTPKPAASKPASAAPVLPSAPPGFSGLSGVVSAPATILSDNGASILSTYGGRILSNNGGGILSTYGGRIVSNNGGGILSTYGGRLVSNNGGSIISNGGAGIVSNSGGTYRVLLAGGDEAALAGALLYLTDRDGKFYLNTATKDAFRVTADAEGRFRFPSDAPGFPKGKDVVVNAMLPDNQRLVGSLAPTGGPDAVRIGIGSTLATELLRGESLRVSKPMGQFDAKAFAAIAEMTREAIATGAIEAVADATDETGRALKAGTFDLRADHVQDLRNLYAIALSATAAGNDAVKALSDAWKALIGYRPVAVTTVIGNGRQPRVGAWGREVGVEGDHRGGYKASGLQTPAGYVYGVAASRRGDVFVAGYTEAPLSGHVRWIKPNGTVSSVWLPNYPLQTPTGVAVLQEPTDDPVNPGWLVVADLAANRVYAVAIVEGPTDAGAARFPMRVLAGETEALYGLALPPESPLLVETTPADGTTPARSRFRLTDEGKRQYAATGVRVREPARWAYLNAPRDVEVDELGNVYIADRRNHRIRMIAGEKAAGRTLYGYRTGFDDDGDGDVDRHDSADTPLAAGAIYTIAGNPVWDAARTPDTGTGRWFGDYGGDGSRAQDAKLDQPNALAYRDGYLYVSDTDNQRIRRISRATGQIETFAGKPAGSQRHDGTDYDFPPGTAGDGGAAVGAQLSYPMGLGFDAKGRLYLADRDSGRLRRVNTDGRIDTVAGRLHDPAASGPLADQSTDGEARYWADLFDTQGLDVDASGNVLFCDGRHLRLRKLWRQWEAE